MAYEMKSKGISMFRIVAGLSIARNISATFTPKELKEIIMELDIKVPRKNPYMVPKYLKDANQQQEPTA